MQRFLYLLLLTFLLFILSLAVLFAGTESSSANWSALTEDGIGGDVNSDGRCDIFDLLALLPCIAGTESCLPEGDLDHNSEVDLFDLIKLLGMLSAEQQSQEKLDFAILIGSEFLGERCFMWLPTYDGCNRDIVIIPEERNYSIHSNKTISEVTFIFGTDTLRTLEGQISPSFEPFTLDSPIIGDHSEVEITVPWQVNLKADDGTEIDSAGTTEFRLIICATFDGSIPTVGREIEFPLTLEGSPQQFLVLTTDGQFYDTLVVDLNPQRQASITYPDIDSLVTAINASIPPDVYYIEITPAVHKKSGIKADRLFLYIQCWCEIRVESKDGNEKLMSRLGFPAWLPGKLVDCIYWW